MMIAVGLLTACVPNRQDYDAHVTLLQGSSRAISEAVKDCATGFDANGHRGAGLATNVSDADASRLACERFVAAVVSGRITYDDVVDVKQHGITPKIIKLFQGR